MNQALLVPIGWSVVAGVGSALGLWGVTNMGSVWAALSGVISKLKVDVPMPTPTVVDADRASLKAAVVALRHKASEGKPDGRAADLDRCDDFDALIDRLFPEAAK